MINLTLLILVYLIIILELLVILQLINNWIYYLDIQISLSGLKFLGSFQKEIKRANFVLQCSLDRLILSFVLSFYFLSQLGHRQLVKSSFYTMEKEERLICQAEYLAKKGEWYMCSLWIICFLPGKFIISYFIQRSRAQLNTGSIKTRTSWDTTWELQKSVALS